MSDSTIHHLTDHLFRHEAGKMVAVLTKILGTENLETAEDVVQQTFIDAMQVWKLKGVPDNPAAWLFRVAKNKAIDVIRRNKHSVHYDFNDSERALLTSEYTLVSVMENYWKKDSIQDDVLKMMFACCHPGISPENQITLVLKTLCSFSTAEIAKAFLTSEDNVSKRLYRTKEYFRQQKIKLEIPTLNHLANRTHAVLNAIYLLFNEGYNSTHSDDVIRKDLIDEAMLLCKLLIGHKHTQLPEAFALMALMCFHASRSDSRLTTEGEIILLSQQDRSKWNHQLIEAGNEYMNKAAFGDTISSYHIEAAIAYEHCTAPQFESTNWKRILELYDWLCKINPSEITEINKAVVILKLEGPVAALTALHTIKNKTRIEEFYLYQSLLGEIYALLHDKTKATSHYEKAIELTQSDKEKNLLRDKLSSLLN